MGTYEGPVKSDERPRPQRCSFCDKEDTLYEKNVSVDRLGDLGDYHITRRYDWVCGECGASMGIAYNISTRIISDY
jgi:hypothetical protein